MDLVVATHGRGIYRTNLKAIQQKYNAPLIDGMDYLFEVDTIQRPWFNSNGGEPDYRTIKKATFSLWLKESMPVELSLRDQGGKVVWRSVVQGDKGFFQYRWDLVINRETSNQPYFINYDQFIEAGTYTLVASVGSTQLEGTVYVVETTSPYVK